MNNRRYVLILFVAVIMMPVTMYAMDVARQVAGEFSSGSLTGWEEEEFEGKTEYRIIETKAGKALSASSNAAASGLFKKIKVDLNKTPYINWSWNVGNIMPGLDERTKAGDDFPARVYVVHEGFFFWQTIAINYVWSGNSSKGEDWPNPFTSNAHMVAVDAGSQGLGEWASYKRNVKQDFKQFHDEDISEIHVVAVMSDSDNAGKSATALYGDIYFTSE